MTQTTKIREIFTSIQGEGPYVGVKQLFIRFCGCNLACEFCDTEDEENNEDVMEFSAESLKNHIQKFHLQTIHSISLTGGEPLLWTDFLLEFLPLMNNKIYLETNSTLGKPLEKIIDYVDIIAGDIKLPSCSGIENSFALHDEFFRSARKYDKEIFAKIVFDENILENEISNCVKLATKYTIPLILQPKMVGNNLTMTSDKVLEIFNKFLENYSDVRVIPQVHNFLQIQ